MRVNVCTNNFLVDFSDHHLGWGRTRQMIVSGGSRHFRHRCNLITSPSYLILEVDQLKLNLEFTWKIYLSHAGCWNLNRNLLVTLRAATDDSNIPCHSFLEPSRYLQVTRASARDPASNVTSMSNLNVFSIYFTKIAHQEKLKTTIRSPLKVNATC